VNTLDDEHVVELGDGAFDPADDVPSRRLERAGGATGPHPLSAGVPPDARRAATPCKASLPHNFGFYNPAWMVTRDR
jgi:hypothetical protein